MTQQNDKPKPIKDFRAGHIQASIWRNEVQKDGQTILRYSVRIQKQFRKDDSSYEGTNYFFPDELPKLLVLSQRAYEYIVLTESKDAGETVPV